MSLPVLRGFCNRSEQDAHRRFLRSAPSFSAYAMPQPRSIRKFVFLAGFSHLRKWFSCARYSRRLFTGCRIEQAPICGDHQPPLITPVECCTRSVCSAGKSDTQDFLMLCTINFHQPATPRYLSIIDPENPAASLARQDIGRHTMTLDAQRRPKIPLDQTDSGSTKLHPAPQPPTSGPLAKWQPPMV